MSQLLTRHKTIYIPEIDASIDEIIAPVVRWLNSFPTVKTLFSCHGNPANSNHRCKDAYVLFDADEDGLWAIINSATKKMYPYTDFCNVEIIVNFGVDHLRYSMRWENRDHLVRWWKINYKMTPKLRKFN